MHYFASIILPLTVLCLASIGIGALGMQLFARRPKDSAGFEFVMCFLLGLGILGNVLIFPALAHVFTLPVVLLGLVPCGAYGAVYLCRQMRGMHKDGVLCAHEIWHAAWLWKLLAIMVFGILVFGGCSAATMLTDDARAFYMVLPRVIATSHRLVPLPFYEGFNMVGLLAEMPIAALFLLGMPDNSPRLLCWIVALVAVPVLIALARIAGVGRRGQLLCLAMLVSSTAVAYLWGSGKTDFFAAVFGLCACYYALRSWEAPTRKQAIVLTAVFTGFALVAKLSYVVALAPGICILLWWEPLHGLLEHWRFRKPCLALIRKMVVEGLFFAAIVALVLFPQFFKNWLLYADAFKTLGDDFQWFAPHTIHRIQFSFPLILTFGNYWAQFGDMSPLLLAFLPLGFLVPNRGAQRRGPVAALTAAALFSMLAWVLLFPAAPFPRYIMATLLLLFIPAAWSAEQFMRLGRYCAVLICSLTMLVLVLFYIANKDAFFNLHRVYHLVAGKPPIGEPISDEVASAAVFDVLNQVAEPGARLATLTFFKAQLRVDLVQTALTSSERDALHALNSEKEASKMWPLLHTSGIRYIVAQDSFAVIKLALLLKAKPSWVKLVPLAAQGEWHAYRVEYRHPPTRVAFTSREVSDGAWDVVAVP